MHAQILICARTNLTLRQRHAGQPLAALRPEWLVKAYMTHGWEFAEVGTN